MKQERFDYVDYAKAIMIIVVVVAHTNISPLFEEFGKVLFCLFFVCSGFTTSVNGKTPKEMIISRFKKLMLPCWAMCAVSAVFEVWRAYHFGYGDYRMLYAAIAEMIYGVTNKLPIIPGVTDCLVGALPYDSHPEGFLDTITPSMAHFWFLPAMFTASVIFILYTHFVKKRGLLDGVMIVVLLIFTYIESLPWVAQFPLCLGRGCLFCAFMIVGLYLRYFEVFVLNTKGYMIFAASTVIAGVSYYLRAGNGEFLLSVYPLGNIWGVFLIFVGGVSVTVSLLFALKFFSEKGKCGPLLYIGKNTMTIYLWHIMFLTIFAEILLRIAGVPPEFDEFCGAFIPQDRDDIKILTAVLSLGMCIFIGEVKKKLFGYDNLF